MVAEPICTGTHKCKPYFGLLRALYIAPCRTKLFCLSLSRKQLVSPCCVLGLAVSCGWGSLESNPDLVSTFILTDLTGSCSRPKTPSKTCAPQRASPVAGASLFHSFSSEYCCCRCPGNCSVSSRAVGRSGVAAQEKREIVIILLELRIQKKGEERGQKLVRNLDPFLVPLSIWHIPEGSESGLIFGPAFSAGKPLTSSLLESQNLRAESPFFGKMQRITRSVASYCLS